MAKDNPIKVLVAEDNIADARLVEIMLADAGDDAFQVAHADHLSSAIKHVKTERADVVLLDLGLPDSKGIDTALSMVRAAPKVPVVVLTGLDDGSAGIEAVRHGVQDYLVKGQIEGPLIRRTIRYAIDRHQTFDVLRGQLCFQQQMIDALPIPIFYTDRSSAVLGCNRAFEELIGKGRLDLLGGEIQEVLPEAIAKAFQTDDDDRPGRDKIASIALESGKKGQLVRTTFTSPDGEMAGFVVTFSAKG